MLAARKQVLPPLAQVDTVKTRILLADDHALTREGIRRLLSTQKDVEIVAEAASGQEALDLMHEARPDVVIMDISMPELNGIQTTQIIRRLFPHVQVVAQSGHSENAFVRAMFNAGASAYILKAFLSEDLLCAIRSVVAGKPYLGTEVRDHVDDALISSQVPPAQPRKAQLKDIGS